MFILMGGWPTDGGFGDYSPPYDYDYIPLRFKSKEDAEAISLQLNHKSAKTFYESNPSAREQYSGMFPYEYFLAELPDNFTEIPAAKAADYIESVDKDSWRGDY